MPLAPAHRHRANRALQSCSPPCAPTCCLWTGSISARRPRACSAKSSAPLWVRYTCCAQSANVGAVACRHPDRRTRPAACLQRLPAEVRAAERVLRQGASCVLVARPRTPPPRRTERPCVRRPALSASSAAAPRTPSHRPSCPSGSTTSRAMAAAARLSASSTRCAGLCCALADGCSCAGGDTRRVRAPAPVWLVLPASPLTLLLALRRPPPVCALIRQGCVPAQRGPIDDGHFTSGRCGQEGPDGQPPLHHLCAHGCQLPEHQSQVSGAERSGAASATHLRLSLSPRRPLCSFTNDLKYMDETDTNRSFACVLAQLSRRRGLPCCAVLRCAAGFRRGLRRSLDLLMTDFCRRVALPGALVHACLVRRARS